ncbi:MAG TPA: ThuA domain-containing protein [Armatimonadetes bacterium]|nr:ThuA domain-containing protein [Armatimonadota bacterium]
MSETKRVLFFSKSSGFEHDTIKRGDKPASPVEEWIVPWAAERGYEVVCSKDGSLFDADYLDGFDAYLFCTTGDLTTVGTDGQPPLSAEGKAALLAAIAGGKGFLGVHNATDTFHGANDTVDDYTAMLGGQFLTHGAQQNATQLKTDVVFPGLEALPDSFVTHDEWYVQKNLADDLRVILLQSTEGMEGDMYTSREAYPATWARREGEGRVFYTSMGHRPDNWTAPEFQLVLAAGLDWITGRTEAGF